MSDSSTRTHVPVDALEELGERWLEQWAEMQPKKEDNPEYWCGVESAYGKLAGELGDFLKEYTNE